MKLRWCDRRLVINPYYLTLCTTERLFRKALRHLRIKKADRPEFIHNRAHATTHFFETKDGGLCAIVCMRDTDRTGIQKAALIVHEAVHIWQAAKRDLGERGPSDEFEAYAIQAISQELMTEYSRQVHGRVRSSHRDR